MTEEISNLICTQVCDAFVGGESKIWSLSCRDRKTAPDIPETGNIVDDPAIEMQDKTEEAAQMVKHIILWQFKDELTEDRKNELGKEIKEKLEALHGRIPGLIEIHVQADILPSSNADLMLNCSFTDEAALDGYAVHPEHVKIKDGIIGPSVKSRVCIDYHV